MQITQRPIYINYKQTIPQRPKNQMKMGSVSYPAMTNINYEQKSVNIAFKGNFFDDFFGKRKGKKEDVIDVKPISSETVTPKEEDISTQKTVVSPTLDEDSIKLLQDFEFAVPNRLEEISKEELISNFINEINAAYQGTKPKIQACNMADDIKPPVPTPEGTRLYNELDKSGMSGRDMFAKVALMINGGSDNGIYDDALLKIVERSDMDVNRRYQEDYNVWCNPLFILTTLDKPYILQAALKKRNADPNLKSGSNHTLSPLYRAVDFNMPYCTYVLLKSGKIKDSVFEECKSLSMGPNIRTLFEYYPDIDNAFEKKFEEASRSLQRRHIKTLEDVLALPDVNVNFTDSYGNNFAHIISYIDDEERALKLLINAKKLNVDINHPNNDGIRPVQLYMQGGKYKLVTALMDKDTDFSAFKDEYGNSLGHIICNYTDEENAMAMLSYGLDKGIIDVDAQNCAGVTMLMDAVKSQKYKLLLFLIDSAAANLNIQDINGNAAIHHACILNDKEAIQILANKCAHIVIKNLKGQFPEDCISDAAVKAFLRTIPTKI